MSNFFEDITKKYGNKEPFVSAKAIAKHLSMNVSTIYKQAQRDKVPSHKIGKSRRFKISEVEASLEK